MKATRIESPRVRGTKMKWKAAVIAN